MATCMATSFSGDKQSLGRTDARPLTDLAIKNLKAGESRTDGALPVGNGRLVVSCTKARGQLRRVWTFRYRKEALRGELKIGEHPALSLEHARNEARSLLELVRLGNDPKVARIESRFANIAYFSPSWTPFQADRGRRVSLIVDAVSSVIVDGWGWRASEFLTGLRLTAFCGPSRCQRTESRCAVSERHCACTCRPG